ncbi:MAG: glycerate kinase [Deltaproteobacteria bacterium]|nr:glycerate kinase [Deltaproteobacteria bacterium]
MGVIPRALCEQAYRAAVQACSLERRVRAAFAEQDATTLAPGVYIDHPGVSVGPLRVEREKAKHVFAVAVGKGALAMARGFARVKRGIAVAPADDGRPMPPGWQVVVAAHPHPDERSERAGAAVRALVEDATDRDIVFALISGGASALIEQPRLPLDELAATARAVMHAGAPIADLNVVRTALSELKGGGLARACAARIVTLVASDVVGDPLDTIGSGPTIGPWLGPLESTRTASRVRSIGAIPSIGLAGASGATRAGGTGAVGGPGVPVDFGALREARRLAAVEILERHELAVPAVLRAPFAADVVTRNDRAEVIAPLASFAKAVAAQLARIRVIEPAVTEDVAVVASRVAALSGWCVAYGEPTLEVPAEHGEGGRAQHLALLLARAFRSTARSAFVAGSDGVDGPPPRARPAPAGAYVDGSTWDAIVAAGIDPAAALARCDAGTALAAAGALFAPGPTGINHADVILVG